MEKFLWHDTRQEVSLNTTAAATSRPGTRCSLEDAKQNSSSGNNDYPAQPDGSWAAGSSLHGRAPEEMFHETVRSPSVFHRPKSRGLTLSSLDRLSPSMVTLQSLVSDWPPNTVDSGYEPSPLSGDIFTYSEDDIQQDCDGQSSFSWRSNGSYLQAFAELSPSYIGARSRQRVKPDFHEHDSVSGGTFNSPSHQGSSSSRDGSCKSTPLLSKVMNMERNSPMSATPPIAIPRNAVSLTRPCHPVSLLDIQNLDAGDFTKKGREDSSVTSETSLESYNEQQSFEELLPLMSGLGNVQREAISHSTQDEQVPRSQNLKSSNAENDQNEMCNFSDSPSSHFRRPRAYSCPETSRPTPTRPPVPLFSSQTPGPSDLHSGNQNLIFYTQNTDFLGTANSHGHCENPPSHNLPRATTEPSSKQSLRGFPGTSGSNYPLQVHHETAGTGQGSGRFVPPGGIVHARNWSSPVTTPGKDTRPLFLPPMPLRAVPLKPAGSREGIVDLSDDGPGHRRRVLVLALPDVVVDTHHQQQGAGQLGGHDPQHTPPGTPHQACPTHHSRQGSSSGDSVPPLRSPSTGVSPSRRAWTRPRALSCDVTLEETAGRALRKIADDFESGRRRSRDQSLTFLGRVRRSFRRSFSKLLNGHSSDDDLDDRHQHAGATVDFFEERHQEIGVTSTRRIRRQSYVDATNTLVTSASETYSTSYSSSSHHATSSAYITSSASTSGDEFEDDDCFGPPSNEAEFVLYDLAAMKENDGAGEGEPRYSLTRRGGDDFEYFL